MTRIERATLPGIGTLYTLHLHDNQRVGIISHRGGNRELVCYSADDPDTADHTLRLTAAEGQAVAELLHPMTTIDHVVDLESQVDGVTIAGLPVRPASDWAGHSIGEVVTRAGPGVCVVAIVRAGQTTPGPDPDIEVRTGDVLVAAGAADRVSYLAEQLAPAEA